MDVTWKTQTRSAQNNTVANFDGQAERNGPDMRREDVAQRRPRWS